ncbi:MAG TPA: hypothetical protein VLF93_06650 [Candidatus Saccharimonadales bacterium]|nr:hypothetical protein [Candidatus Saccharimonadales bacterium]
MKKNVKRKKRSNSKKLQRGTVGNFFVFGVLVLLIAVGITAVGGLPSVVAPKTGKLVQIVTPTLDPSHSTLQLETFGFTTLAPTAIPTAVPTGSVPATTLPPSSATSAPPPPPVNPGSFPTSSPNAPICADDDDGVMVSPSCRCLAFTVECVNGQPENISPVGQGYYSKLPVTGLISCGTPPYAANGRYCVGKPVIYLYPKVPTYVSVQVQTSGSIVVSDPIYPQGGWKNILAYPNGSFDYQNRTYTELFYESSVTNFEKPEQGIVIPTKDLVQNLNGVLSQLGLIGAEKEEFISYWLPKLQTLNSPYIFFSVLSPSVKDAIDHVVITPTPDTQIAFIAYFKPVSTPNYGSPLILPPTPKRIGFTSVEWGGVIDK